MEKVTKSEITPQLEQAKLRFESRSWSCSLCFGRGLYCVLGELIFLSKLFFPGVVWTLWRFARSFDSWRRHVMSMELNSAGILNDYRSIIKNKDLLRKDFEWTTISSFCGFLEDFDILSLAHGVQSEEVPAVVCTRYEVLGSYFSPRPTISSYLWDRGNGTTVVWEG